MATEGVKFLTELWGTDLPGALRIALWAQDGKKSTYLSGPAEAAPFDGREQVWAGCALADRDLGPRKRVSREHAVGIAGFWLDIDGAGPADTPIKRPAPDEPTALKLAHAVRPPTLIVGSGYGWQPWWLFDEPWVFGSDEERDQAARMCKGWEVAHRTIAQGLGFDIDAVADLARIMRLPGTFNTKAGGRVPVQMLDYEGPRYDVTDLAPYALTSVSVSAPVTADVSNAIDPAYVMPADKFEGLRDNTELFGPTWSHTRRDREAKGWTLSEYDMSLARQAARAGWTDNEIAALLREHRRKYGSDKGERTDYVRRTVRAARNELVFAERDVLITDSLADLCELSDNANGSPPDKARAMKLFSVAVGGGIKGSPQFTDLVQYGLHPERARFALVTDKGEEIDVGEYANLREPRRLDRRVAPVLAFPLTKIKESEEWIGAVRTLMQVRTVKEEPEPPCMEWARRYLEDVGFGRDRKEAAREGAPFIENGMVHIKATNLARFVTKVLRERVNTDDLPLKLTSAGFERCNVHTSRSEGSKVRTTVSYYRIREEDIT